MHNPTGFVAEHAAALDISRDSVRDTTGDLTLSSTLWMLGSLGLGLALLYFIGVDQGAVSVTGPGALLHELFHDARHSLGFPCH